MAVSSTFLTNRMSRQLESRTASGYTLTPRMSGWIERLRKTDPERAARLEQRQKNNNLFRNNPSAMDADARNEMRKTQYERNLKNSNWLQKNVVEASRTGKGEWGKVKSHASGHYEIPTWDGQGTRLVKVNSYEVNRKEHRNEDQQSWYTSDTRYRLGEEDQAWAANAKMRQSDIYRKPVRIGKGGRSAGSNTAGTSTFIVGERSALGEGGKEAARTATLTTSGAASKNAQAAAATKRKLK